MDILEHLEEEHRKVEKMIADLESTRTIDQREPILAKLGDSLSKHMEVEEERIYPLVDDRLGSNKAREARKSTTPLAMTSRNWLSKLTRTARCRARPIQSGHQPSRQRRRK